MWIAMSYKRVISMTPITAVLITLLIIINSLSLGYDVSKQKDLETVTYTVLRTYEETNQSIYGTWRDYYVVTTEGKVFKVSSEEYYASKTTGKFIYRKY